ncbi:MULTISPECIES: hypothetical protein [Streptomyces]|uniref:Uncharacterized protein n=1 Tax=Streptomyces venezuelae (strain ATCC 10712 / CBS 650.69 / DSM 40230 / JCM 4526 / NBRC 13096 / PD 04745) TaxID=953739 RepID=F2RL22_STRVP|nr:hypothetical protein [Streptomyces venezuelae]APE21390.1 hypothetical protein vnz_10390 [Streptomyces venezuelae]QER98781.1 hypothetical protein DEJ43_10530 [Streptomyces venezuelae ATCC 10712]CCA55411.1 hypothetical protein SVEN_2125 [Streptomyces venezuelae ATCC 10712]
MFGRKAAAALDNAAAALHDTGKKVAGNAGGRVGDTIANAVLAPIRNQINASCTNCSRGKCKKH